MSQLNTAGFDAYIVGGCVRDALLDNIPYDWDVCTSAIPEEVINCLKNFRIVETGIKHGTITVVTESGICEITTFRKEGTYKDHRHPDAVFYTSEISEDLARRDFTINAMAFNPHVELIDLFRGQSDLNSGLIKCVGDPKKRFEEDALRIIRALRFASCLGFDIEEKTKTAIFECQHLIRFVAKERLIKETERLICGINAYRIISEFSEVFKQFLFKIDTSETSLFLKKSPSEFNLRLALLFSETDVDITFDILKELKFSNKTLKLVCFLLEHSCNFHPDRIQIRKLLSQFGREKTKQLCEFVFIKDNYEPEIRDTVRNWVTNSPIVDFSALAVKGQDIIELGSYSGKEIGYVLKDALDAVLEDKCSNTKTELIEYITKQSFEK